MRREILGVLLTRDQQIEQGTSRRIGQQAENVFGLLRHEPELYKLALVCQVGANSPAAEDGTRIQRPRVRTSLASPLVQAFACV